MDGDTLNSPWPSERAYRRLLLLTVAVAILLLFWGLGSLQLLSLNEGRRALAIKEMYYGGDWLLPHLNGQLYLTKPPLLYWLSAACSSLAGTVDEWTLRLPSALSALAVLLMVYGFMRRRFGAWPALFSVQLLLANAGFAMLARRVEIEMLLTALCTGAVLAALQYSDRPQQRRWLYLSYALLGLAVLTKGPVALLFVTLPLLLAWALRRDQALRQLLLDVRGWALFLVLGLSWYLLVTGQLGMQVWSDIARHDMLDKMQAADAKPLLSYLGWIATDFLLLVALLLVAPARWLAEYRARGEFNVMVLAVLAPLLVFSLFSNKHAKYLLPVYPFIAMLLALQLQMLMRHAVRWRRQLILAAGLLLPVGFAAYYMFAEARIFHYRVAVFPQLQAWGARQAGIDIYALTDIDSRVLYYAGRPVQSLTFTQLRELKHSGKPALLLAEQDQRALWQGWTDCQLATMQPYLKQHRALLVLGLGHACNATTLPPHPPHSL